MKLHLLMCAGSSCPACGSRDTRYRREVAVGRTCDHGWHGPLPPLSTERAYNEPPAAQFIDTSFEATQRRIRRLP
jgi:hypothetical protein